MAVAGLLGELPGTAAWISFSCVDGARIRGGAPIEEAVDAIRDAPGVVATGVNCTAPEHVDELLARIRSVTALPLVVYPNSGEGWDAGRVAAGRAAPRVASTASRPRDGSRPEPRSSAAAAG